MRTSRPQPFSDEIRLNEALIELLEGTVLATSLEHHVAVRPHVVGDVGNAHGDGVRLDHLEVVGRVAHGDGVRQRDVEQLRETGQARPLVDARAHELHVAPRGVRDTDAVRGKLGTLALAQLAEHGKIRTGVDDLHDVVGAEERCDAGVPLARDELGAGHAREVGALRGGRRCGQG